MAPEWVPAAGPKTDAAAIAEAEKKQEQSHLGKKVHSGFYGRFIPLCINWMALYLLLIPIIYPSMLCELLLIEKNRRIPTRAQFLVEMLISSRT